MQSYKPHDYQEYATNFILSHPACGLLLDMGLGKTVITLTALWSLLLDYFEVGRVLIIAPLRVARDTWPKEIAKWEHLKGLTYSVVVGSEKERREALAKPAFIYIVNRENVCWLIENGYFHFDCVVIDELSSFKSHQSKRFKALRKARPTVKRVIGLTGSPTPNGLIDLWAQINLLDMGERFGRFIGGFRERYFMPDKRNRDVIFSYKPREGAEEAIYEKISDICVSMKAADHLNMPELIISNVEVEMSEKEKQMYDGLKADLIIPLEGGDIDAPSAVGLKFYCFTGFDRADKWDAAFWKQDIFDLFTRIEILMKNKCLPYVMRFNRYEESPYRGVYISIARWCNQPSFFKKKSLREFADLNGETSACYRYLSDFEEKFPEVAYFYDLKFERSSKDGV